MLSYASKRFVISYGSVNVCCRGKRTKLRITYQYFHPLVCGDASKHEEQGDTELEHNMVVLITPPSLTFKGIPKSEAVKEEDAETKVEIETEIESIC